jgi:hypothetical protein
LCTNCAGSQVYHKSIENLVRILDCHSLAMSNPFLDFELDILSSNKHFKQKKTDKYETQ